MFNYSFKIFARQNKTVTENNLVNDIKVTVRHLLENCQNYAFCFVAVSKFVCYVNGGKPVRSFFVYV